MSRGLTRDRAAALGAIYAASHALTEWQHRYGRPGPVPELEAPGRLVVGPHTAYLSGADLIEFGRVKIGPIWSWQAAAVVPWLILVMHNAGGSEAAHDAAHALGAVRTDRRTPAGWRNRWSTGGPSTGPAGWATPGHGPWTRTSWDESAAHYRVSDMYLSAYFACFDAVGIPADDDERMKAQRWESVNRRETDDLCSGDE